MITSISRVTEGDTIGDIPAVMLSSKPFSCSSTISSVITTKTKRVTKNNMRARINLEVIHPAFLVVVDVGTVIKLLFVSRINLPLPSQIVYRYKYLDIAAIQVRFFSFTLVRIIKNYLLLLNY